ncbi:MAG: hypothetical protein JWN85_3888 [Gammaproteobacteria bacterium]|nr:hypothetical protein [Gammaproteobacteria bacterium]
MRLIRAIYVPVLVSLLLAGCGGGSSAASSAPTSSTATGASSSPPPTPTPTPTPPPTPTPVTGTATVSWVAPTLNSDGSSLTSLAGYTIHYGVSATSLTQSIQVANAGAVSYVVTNLSSGTWYFAVSAYTNADVQSALSTVSSKTI